MAVIATSVGLLIAIVVIGQTAGFRINLTPSYPLGLWRIILLDQEVRVGDLIFICPPSTYAFEQARVRGYLRRGLCPGWLSPLIKTVAALPGQQIQIDDAVSIDGSVLSHSQVRSTDAEGRTLDAFSGGVVPPDHLFLHSSFAGSYDSRYFGPIPAAGLLGKAQPLVTFGP